MDYLWTPWRYAYVTQAGRAEGCVFCQKQTPGDDQRQYVIHRGRHNYLVLNIYPYTVGHLMVVPCRHVATLEECQAEELGELMELTRRAEAALRRLYRPQGFNIGMNIGASAGAGVAGHLHMHVLPRWEADSNFVSVIGETRVLPEELPVTWAKLRGEFGS